MFVAPTVDNGCCFGHHFWQRSSDLLKTQVAAELINYRWWMSFSSPFVTTGERFVKNTSSSTIKLIMLLFIELNKTKQNHPWPIPSDGRVSAVAQPLQKRGYQRRIRQINRCHFVVGAKWDSCVRVDGTFCTIFTLKIPRFFFVPTRTKIGVTEFICLSGRVFLKITNSSCNFVVDQERSQGIVGKKWEIG